MKIFMTEYQFKLTYNERISGVCCRASSRRVPLDGQVRWKSPSLQHDVVKTGARQRTLWRLLHQHPGQFMSQTTNTKRSIDRNKQTEKNNFGKENRHGISRETKRGHRNLRVLF
ncbi:uncharacterized protein LOC121372224 [Gigantopelta aegis]|uniref:uncharacterized protein LOC121372224 n=1 Tax=Gigantopelta aegis TaxID=1735272 RepID=UPI001B8894CC|nr:uncharacterized protein LOC121372224 [Gigantopelta aegis]